MAKKQIGLGSAIAIGIGGMVGGGIFAVLGIAVELARGATAVAFAAAGLIALITSYSYARLSVTFPSQGGTVEFLNQAFGVGIFTGGLNILLFLSYIIMVSLYAFAFGSYGASFFSITFQPVLKHILLTGVIIAFTALNLLGARTVGSTEELIVALKLSILLVFIGVGFFSVRVQNLSPAAWPGKFTILTGGMIIFVAYEGFELIANAAQDITEPKKTLPLAFFSSVIFVIILYVAISLVTLGNLPVNQIVTAKDYALAAGAKPFLGGLGFVLVAIAALLSTASAINATLYGTARVSYVIAKEGELPAFMEQKVWRRPVEGLLITAGLALLIANLFDIASISIMGSAGFLLIFAAVNAANLRLSAKTLSRGWISAIGCGACLIAFAALVWQGLKTAPIAVIVFVALIIISLLTEAVYRRVSGRKLKPFFGSDQ